MIFEHLDNRRVLITGATGFVGQHLARHLLGCPRIGVRIMARSPDRVREVFRAHGDSLEIVIADLTDRMSLTEVCKGVDVIFHSVGLGSSSLRSDRSSSEFNRVNVQGTMWLAEQAIRFGVTRFVHVSSTAAMGVSHERVIVETTACRPSTPYQRSKWAAEQALFKMRRETDLDVVIVRPCLIAGEGKRGGELLDLFRLCRKGLFPVFGRDLDIEKPLIYVDDVVQALLLASGRGHAGQIYLVHSDGHHTLGQILRVAGQLVGNPKPYRMIPLPLARAAAYVSTPLAKLLGRSPPLSPERLKLFITSRHIDISKAREELGFNPQHQDLHEMLGRTHTYYIHTGQL